MKVATVLESSEPVSIILKQSGIISVVRRKLMTSCSSVFTSAPITPKLKEDESSQKMLRATIRPLGKINIPSTDAHATCDHSRHTHTCSPGKSEILKRARLRSRMEKWVEVEGNVSEQKGGPGVGVRGDTLQQRQGVAHPVGLMRGQSRRVDRWVNVDDFLKQCSDRPERMPEHGGQIWYNFSLLAAMRRFRYITVNNEMMPGRFGKIGYARS